MPPPPSLPSYHLIQVLSIDAQLLKEGDSHNEKLRRAPIQERHEHGRHALVDHLKLHPHILRQVEKQVQHHSQQRLLLPQDNLALLARLLVLQLCSGARWASSFSWYRQKGVDYTAPVPLC